MPKIISNQEAAQAKATYLDGTQVVVPSVETEPVETPPDPMALALSGLGDAISKLASANRSASTIKTAPDYSDVLYKITGLLHQVLAREPKPPVVHVTTPTPKTPPVLPPEPREWVFEINRDQKGRMESIVAVSGVRDNTYELK